MNAPEHDAIAARAGQTKTAAISVPAGACTTGRQSQSARQGLASTASRSSALRSLASPGTDFIGNKSCQRLLLVGISAHQRWTAGWLPQGMAEEPPRCPLQVTLSPLSEVIWSFRPCTSERSSRTQHEKCSCTLPSHSSGERVLTPRQADPPTPVGVTHEGEITPRHISCARSLVPGALAVLRGGSLCSS